MKYLIILLFLIVIGTQPVVSQTVMNKTGNLLKFSSYMEMVKSHNLDLASEQFEVNKSEAAIEIAKAFPNPTLSASWTKNQENKVTTGHDVYTELGKTVELFGKRKARIDLARSGNDLAKALLSDFYRNLQADAAAAFLEALKQKQLYQVKLSSYQTMKKLSEADSMRLKSGSIMEIDAIQSKLEAGSLYNELLQAGTDLNNSLTKLSQMTGSLNPDFLPDPDGSLMFKQRLFDIGELINLGTNKRADLVAALYNKEVAAKALKVAKKERNIDVDLKLGLQNSYQTGNTGPSADAITGGIAIPLKFSNIYRGQVKMAEAQVSQSDELYKKAELQIRSEIYQSMQNYQALCKQVDSFDHGMLEGAMNVRKGKIYSYERGETSLLEVLNAQRTFNDIQQSYYETLFNRAVALVELEKSAGIWDVDF